MERRIAADWLGVWSRCSSRTLSNLCIEGKKKQALSSYTLTLSFPKEKMACYIASGCLGGWSRCSNRPLSNLCIDEKQVKLATSLLLSFLLSKRKCDAASLHIVLTFGHDVHIDHSQTFVCMRNRRPDHSLWQLFFQVEKGMLHRFRLSWILILLFKSASLKPLYRWEGGQATGS